MPFLQSAYRVLSRKKVVTAELFSASRLAKVLTTLDLTALGVGSTLGVGVYVLAGQVAKNVAGPSVVLSFLIAAVASVFSGLCYAEFAARVPKAGSAYVYSYVCVGEFIAFLIGWNLILEYVIGAASVVKGMSTYLDEFIDHRMSRYLNETVPMRVEHFAEYPDFFAFGVTMLFSLGVAFGAKESTVVNNLFTLLNLAIVLFVVVSGLFKADARNWSLPADGIPPVCGEKEDADCGTGGFAPYGVSGVVKGAASCFYGFIGFDTIATASEEAKTPQKSIPLATVVSLFVIFMAYFSISTILTMMLPYYQQDVNAPIPHVFETVGWPVARYMVSIGAIFGLCASLFGALFPLPRIIYAMAEDGLIFRFLGAVHPRFKTPFVGTLVAGLLTGVMSAIFELKQLYTMMSIGTLLAYSMVAACVLILRYDGDEEEQNMSAKHFFAKMFSRQTKTSTALTAKVVTVLVTLFSLFCLLLGTCLSQLEDELGDGEWWAVCLVAAFGVLIAATVVGVCVQPVSSHKLPFRVPLVPWIPCLSILINLYLMTKLDTMTWIRFLVWIVIGLLIYFTYGVRNSSQRNAEAKQSD